MTFKICFWDEKEGTQKERDSTPDEDKQREADLNAPLSREQLKAIRRAKVSAIAVVVNGKVFDGDEISQTRMVRALSVASLTGEKECVWVLHDNTRAVVTREELAEALSLSLHAQYEIWLIP